MTTPPKSRFVRILTSAAVVAALVFAAPDAPRSEAVAIPTYAYLGGGTGHHVNVVDDDTKTLSTTIGPLSNDSNWRCNRMTAYGTPDGTRVFQTATCQLNGVVIDTSTNNYTRLGWSATAAAFSPDSQFIYTTSAYYRNAYRVSDGTSVWGVLSPCYRPYSTQWSIATSQDGSKLYIPYQGSCSNPVATYHQVDVLDTATGAPVATITSPDMSSPGWTVAAPTGNRVYVGSNGKINVIDTTTDTVIMSWPIGTNSPVTVSADGDDVYVATGTVVKKLDASNGTEVASYAVSTGECGISLNPAGTHLYALTNGCATLTIVQLSDSSISTLNLPAGQASRNIAWGMVTPAPNISLSSSSGAATVGNPVSSLYTITNSGGPARSYSISPALPSGLSFNSSTGLISGTPTATQASTSYTVTATNSGGTSTATFLLAITNAPPTTTTTTTVSPSTTTAAATQIASATPTTTSATGPGSVSDVEATETAPSRSNTATRSAPISNAVAPTSTTPATTTTTTSVPAPDAPDADAGEGAATMNGESIPVDISRLDNAFVVSGGGISATISGLSPEGTRISLDADGSLRLEESDRIVVEAAGYEPDEDVEVWMFSTPRLLGTVTGDSSGRFSNNFELPAGIEAGAHRLVLKGNTNTGQDIVLSLGINFGAATSTSTVTRWLIIVPVSIAVLIGLLIPTALRRRRNDESAATT